ncbi:aminodeoxychorismate/anthranilate synthase component II [bacterium]|nr:aminodeoxychorismate/anthranilate synthase component II [bacterium]
MSSPVLLIDNYDSFVFNLARYLQELGVETVVRRNDAITLNEIQELAPSAIVISPGPCTPTESGISLELIQEFYSSIPMLGVCLGHQALAQARGGKVVKAPEPYHGRTSHIHHDQQGLFTDCPNPLTICRYHSLIVEEESLPAEFTVTSRTEDGLIMSIQHDTIPLFGVQFHPEAILTHSGHLLLKNFLDQAGIASLPQSQMTGDLITPANSSNDFYQKQIEINARRPM